MVLLKNDGVLPLKTTGLKIAVVGPLAEQTRVLLGNYNGIPSHTVSILEGIRKEFADATVNYVPGTQFLGHDAEPVPAGLLTTGGKPGVKASSSKFDMSLGQNQNAKADVLATRVESAIDLSLQPLPEQVVDVKPLSVSWEATLTANDTGDYNLGLECAGGFQVSVDGRQVVQGYDSEMGMHLGRVHLESGKAYKLNVSYTQSSEMAASARLVWSKVDLALQPKAIAAAKAADVVVAVVGITSELEGKRCR